MLQSEALSKVRNMLNEANAGFYSDNNLYSFMDSAMNIAIEIIITKLEQMKKENMYYGSLVLTPLNTLDSNHTLTNGTSEYSLPANFLYTDYCDFYGIPADYVEFKEGNIDQQNTYTAWTIDNPAYYIRGTKLGFFPTPPSTSVTGYNHYYYKIPTAISSGTASSEIPLKSESHEAIVRITYGLALIKDNKPNEAQQAIESGKLSLAGLY